MSKNAPDNRNRALPHPEDADIKIFVVGLGSEFLDEARLAAERAKAGEAARPGLGGRGASATAVLMAEAACEALLSEYVAAFEYRRVIAEVIAGEIRNERDHARQWARLVQQLAPKYTLGSSSEYRALNCLVRLRNALAHRNASHTTVGTWPLELDPCVRLGMPPVLRNRGHLEWTGQVLTPTVAEWACESVERWLDTAKALLPDVSASVDSGVESKDRSTGVDLTIPPFRPDQPFTEGIGLRRPYGGFQHPQPHGCVRTIDRGRVDRFAVVHRKPTPRLACDHSVALRMVQSAVGCSVTFQWTIRRVPTTSTTNT
jgi:hypothetical protein